MGMVQGALVVYWRLSGVSLLTPGQGLSKIGDKAEEYERNGQRILYSPRKR
jgi:hypothetical protein